MPPPARSDFQQLLEALRAAGYSIHEAEEQEAEEQQPAFLDISSPGAGPDAHLRVYLWRLYAIGVLGRGGFAPVARRRFNVHFRQPETGFRHTLAQAVPGEAESLYVGYEPTRNVYAAWQGRGGWIMAGAKASSLKPLRKGFVPNNHATGTVGTAEEAADGFMGNHYNDPQPFVDANCPTASPPAYTFCYKLDTGSVQVTITLKKTRPGYIFTADSQLAST